MPKVLLRIAHHLLVAALFLGFGGHWVILQTVAWGRMVADYSHDAALTEAVQKTFDGQHPCALCRQIQKAQHGEKKDAVQMASKKVELFQEQAAPFLVAVPGFLELPVEDMNAPVRSREPVTPPPRSA